MVKELETKRQRLNSTWQGLQDWELSKAQGRKEVLDEIINMPETIEQSLKTKAENARKRRAGG
jgi:hypothetical protein